MTTNDQKAKRKKPTAKPDDYKLTEKDVAAFGRYKEKQKEISSARLKVTSDGDRHVVKVDHPHDVLGQVHVMEALGSADADFANGIIKQLVKASSPGRTPDEASINFMLAVIKGMQPRDQIETMIATQMAVVHVTAMRFVSHFASAETIPQQDSADRAFNKLVRTFVALVEALKRYRTGGEQKVTVQHVSVGEGGQAIALAADAAPSTGSRELANEPGHDVYCRQ